LNLPTHEENAIAFSRSLRAFRANQQSAKYINSNLNKEIFYETYSLEESS
jgi:hypothetical protein